MSACHPLLTALKVLILAGGAEASQNHHSHKVHVDSLLAVLDARGVPNADISVFWADGVDPGPDRAVRARAPAEDDWLLDGIRLGIDTDPGLNLLHSTFPTRDTHPAKRAALQSWLTALGPTLGSDDTLLLAVTDHGEPDPTGGLDTRISLWGESWSTKDLLADLAPVPTTARVVLWMSQCYSGGFGELYRHRENTCGAFSANPDRVAYGCYPELAERTDVGHFQRMLVALADGPGDIASASDQTLLTDDTPDTPHLTSDVLLYDLLSRTAESKRVPVPRIADNRLKRVPVDAPVRLQAAQVAARYGLGVLPDYTSAMWLADHIGRTRYALGRWLELWESAFNHARNRLAEPIFRKLRLGRRPSRAKLKKARAKALTHIQARSMEREGHRARLESMRAKVDAGRELLGRADVQEAAALRVLYLYSRAAAKQLLKGEEAARYEALRKCETTPVLPPAPEPRSPDVDQWAPAPPVARLAGAVASLRPGYLGFNYRDGADGVAVVEGALPGSPALVSPVQAGDRIVAVGDWALDQSGALRESALLATPGEWLRVSLKRRRKDVEAEVLVAPFPLPPPPPRLGDPVPDLLLSAYDPKAPLPVIGEGAEVVLYFWSTTCKPCKKAEPALVVWAEERGAAVIAITREDNKTIKRYLRKRRGRNAFPFPIATDERREATRLFEVDRVPVFALVDGGGNLVSEGAGFEDGIPLR